MKLDKVIAVRSNKTVYRDGDKCIKVFDSEYSKANVLNEALNQARIEELGLNIPRILEVTVIDGKWAIVSEYIEGKTLARLMEECPERKNEYIELLVELQMSVQEKVCPLLNKLKDKMICTIANTEFEATTRYDLHTRLESMPKHNKVCHGDFTPSNVIITDSGVPYILDWSHATQGNSAADAANTYLLLLLSGDASGAQFYLDTYCARSNTQKQYVQKWIPLVAASRSVKDDEKEREFMISMATPTRLNI